MSVKEDRLWAENQNIKKWRSRVVTWRTIGNTTPPDTYEFSYDLKSIIGFAASGKPIFHKGFKVLVEFIGDYPREKPIVRFDIRSKPWPLHPNIWKSGVVCLEGTQNWVPGVGVSLPSICQMVGEIIAYQEMYTKSPANADDDLINWVEKNIKLEEGTLNRVKNPIDSSTVRLPDADDAISWGDNSSGSQGRITFG